MSLKANYEFLFVGRDDSSFLENYSYDLFQDHGDRSGQIFINLEVQKNPVDAEEIGGLLFEAMQNTFFVDLGADPYERFEVSLREVNKVLQDFRERKQYLGELNIIVAAIVGDQLLLTQTGDAEAYLIRKRYVSIVSDGLSDENGIDIFSSIASGQIEAGDFVLFSSTRLLRYISQTDLAQCVHRRSIMESLDDVKDVISTEILGRVGLTGILFDKASKHDLLEAAKQLDIVHKDVMESGEKHISVERETLTGKFFSGVRKQTNRVKSSGFDFGVVKKWLSSFKAKLLDKGFGKDKILALLILMILILLVGIFVASGRQAQKEEIERLDGVLNSVEERIAEAETKVAFDKAVAQDLLDQAYADAKAVLDSGIYREKAIMLLGQIEDSRDSLDNVVRLDEPVVLSDLASQASGINAVGFVNVDGKVFIYETDSMYELIVDQLQDPITIDEDESLVAATAFDDRESVVFLTKSGKLIEYRDGNISFMDTDDGSFRPGVVELADYSNKIYLLDPTEGQIWKYTYRAVRNGFGAAEPYVSGENGLEGAVDLAIDGNVYTLSNNSDVMKFYAGAKTEFLIDNPPFNSLTNPSKIYTNEDLDKIYVLDASEKRVMVLQKNARTGNVEYLTQYLFDNVDELRDLYVDDNSLYVLTPTKVLQVKL